MPAYPLPVMHADQSRLVRSLGVGLLVGADIYDVVLILRTHKAVQTFAHPRVTVGGELTVAAGPYGNGFMLESGVEASPVWSYVKSKGLYGGVQIDGNILIERNDVSSWFSVWSKHPSYELTC